MKLSTRLMIAMVALALLTAAAVGLLTHRNLEAAILPVELERVDAHARSLAVDLDTYVHGARADLLAIAGSPAVEGIIATSQPDNTSVRSASERKFRRERLSKILVAQLTAKPEYVQFRFIGAEDKRSEIVRADRSGPEGSVRVVPDDELRDEEESVYFTEMARLAPGEIHISKIELHQETGVTERLYIPIVKITTPITGPDQRILGILIIDVDMRSVFARLRVDSNDTRSIYLVNDQGDYLVHPDTAREFGFDQRRRAQEDFPELAETLASDQDSICDIHDNAGNRLGVAVAPLSIAGGPQLTVIETVPYKALIATAASVVRSSLLTGLAAGLFAFALAVMIARSLTKPLAQMTRAVEEFKGDAAVQVAISAGGEIGMLARAFNRMSDEVREKTATLEREVEERRRAEAEKEILVEKERLYSATVESSTNAIVTITLDGLITGWNPAAEHFYGFTSKEAIGQSINIIVPEDKRQEKSLMLARMRKGEGVEHLETVRRSKSGKLIDVSLAISPIKSQSGAITGASSIARNITKQKQAEEQFRLAVESSPSGMVMVDSGGKILLVNAETERQFGYQRDELIGRSVDMLVPQRFRNEHPQHRGHYQSSPRIRGMGVGRDLYGLRKDGSEFPIEIGLNPIETPEGLRILSAIVDITERKAAEQALAEQTQELQRSNAELEQFAYVASHDLQEPLRMVASYAELLCERYSGRLDEKADKYIQYAVDGARRMQQLVNDLLTYSRVGTQGRPLQPTDADVVLRRILRELQPVVTESQAEIICGKLPMVKADEIQLGQLFQNLISNAIKFCADQPPHVRIDAKPHNGEWIFSVKDNGIGIDPQYSERVFQMFQRLHERSKYAGSGIGLAVAKKIVERHGGRIWLDSVPGAGSTFYFTIQAIEGSSL